MLSILSGLLLLFLSIYVIYQGSIMESGLLKLLGTALFLGAGIYVALTRLKININKMDSYKEALINLSNNPNDETLKELAYNKGLTFYKNKRDNGKVLPMDMMAIERDIAIASDPSKKKIQSLF